MPSHDETRANAQALWTEDAHAVFPPRLRGHEVGGVDTVMLDADVTGCVATWMGSRDQLDEWRRDLLERCLGDLDRIVSLLDKQDERAYFERLRELTVLSLR